MLRENEVTSAILHRTINWSNLLKQALEFSDFSPNPIC